MASLAIRHRTSLIEVGAHLDLPGETVAEPGGQASRGRAEDWLAVRLARLLRAAGMDPSERRSDLRICHRSVEQHVLAKLGWGLGLGLAGLFLGLLLSPVTGVVGAVLLWVICSVGGFYIPELRLTNAATEARRAFRHAYGGYLDLVNVMLAAGAGPESALHAASESGGGWVFAEIRNALDTARRTRQSIATTFAELGDELGVVELEELAASVALIGRQGARVRDSLATKADALRTQQMAETEAQAEAATERMTLPVALLLACFLVLLGYPAVVMISQTGSG